jgi:hypothetical protein
MEGNKAYIIVHATQIDILESKVNHNIDCGFKPLGGIACMVSDRMHSIDFYQAMIEP